MDFSKINSLIENGGSFDNIMSTFNNQIDSHPMVVAHEKMNKNTLATLRKMIKYYNIKGMSGKKKDTLIHALIKVGWSGVVPDDLE